MWLLVSTVMCYLRRIPHGRDVSSGLHQLLKNEPICRAGGCASSTSSCCWEMILEGLTPSLCRSPPLLAPDFTCLLPPSPPHPSSIFPTSICKWSGLSAYCHLQPAQPFITCQRLPAPSTLNCSLSDLRNREWCSCSPSGEGKQARGGEKRWSLSDHFSVSRSHQDRTGKGNETRDV